MSEDYRWDVASWKESLPLSLKNGPLPNVFSPDGRYFAGVTAEGLIHLRQAEPDRTLAVLELPEPGRSYHFTFTPDGSQLIQASTDDYVVYVWDLRELRRQLAEIDLDWDAPPFPPAGEPAARYATPPLEVQVVGADLAVDQVKYAAYQQTQAVLNLWINPFDADAHFRLGDVLLHEGRTEQAHRHLSVGLAFRPDHGHARSRRGQAALHLHRWAEAATDATRLLDAGPADLSIRYQRAEAYQHLNRPAEAVADLTAALARYPENWSCLELRAVCHEALGEVDKARADRERATAMLQQANPIALNNRAWELANAPAGIRNPGRALVLIREAVQRRPDDATLLNTLGVVEYRNGRYREAAASLEKSLAAGQGKSDAFDLFFLAMCHHRLGDAATARDCYDRALRWFGEHRGELEAVHVSELIEFQTEAEQVLKLPPERPPLTNQP
jgi:tetratricopeptide (TPR) repeat protein